ncbi:CGGC domain-containing protein [Prolixibacteraceae bacterium JC049]|nr:CGGC domain-containing protein [Prolixibacteraceae bacterium JC049]
MRKVGIIRCQLTEGACAGTADLRALEEGRCAFSKYGKSILIGIVSCGGCPGEQAGSRAKMLIEQGADLIALTTCITRDNTKKKACVNASRIEQLVKENISEEIDFMDYTH